MGRVRQVAVAGLLLAVGILQMAGDVLGLTAVRAIAAAWGASPAPRVFTSARGLETFSSRFWVEWEDAGGVGRAVELTPEVYERLRGPYNRRNVYGAALAFGPVLASDARTRPMFEAVATRSLCDGAPLLRELGIETTGAPVRIRMEPRAGTVAPGLPMVLQPPCP